MRFRRQQVCVDARSSSQLNYFASVKNRHLRHPNYASNTALNLSQPVKSWERKNLHYASTPTLNHEWEKRENDDDKMAKNNFIDNIVTLNGKNSIPSFCVNEVDFDGPPINGSDGYDDDISTSASCDTTTTFSSGCINSTNIKSEFIKDLFKHRRFNNTSPNYDVSSTAFVKAGSAAIIIDPNKDFQQHLNHLKSSVGHGNSMYYDTQDDYKNRDKVEQSKSRTITEFSNDAKNAELSYTNNNPWLPSNMIDSKVSLGNISFILQGLKSRVYLSSSLANLYSSQKLHQRRRGGFESGSRSIDDNWRLLFTGIPVVLLDSGNTRSRLKRQIQIFLIEKGSGFVLWRDVIDHLSTYTSEQPLFHTMHLSTDHSCRIGLSFDVVHSAQEFAAFVKHLTEDPLNIHISGPGTKSLSSSSSTTTATKEHRKPNKKEISQPCGFRHLVQVTEKDFDHLYSLQTYVGKKLST